MWQTVCTVSIFNIKKLDQISLSLSLLILVISNSWSKKSKPTAIAFTPMPQPILIRNLYRYDQRTCVMKSSRVAIATQGGINLRLGPCWSCLRQVNMSHLGWGSIGSSFLWGLWARTKLCGGSGFRMVLVSWGCGGFRFVGDDFGISLKLWIWWFCFKFLDLVWI